MKLLRPALALAATAWCAPQQPATENPACCRSCKTSSQWSGFDGIKNIFSFGNSYTTTEFDFHGAQPTEDNPFGNPPYPGLTSSRPAANWIGFLTTKYNKSSILTYNMAVGGATVDRKLQRPLFDIVPTLQDQVHERFAPTYNNTGGSAQPLARPWSAMDTLFTFWFGINDVNASYQKGRDVTTPLNRKIIAAYKEVLGFLYTTMGARNFLILNVPSVDRSPGTVKSGQENVLMERADLADFNWRIMQMVAEFKAEFDAAGEANFWVYDSNKDFNKMMDDPKSFPQSSGLTNTTDACPEYDLGTPEYDSFYQECGVPVNQYFWINDLHVTYPVHEVVAARIAELLASGPNMC